MSMQQQSYQKIFNEGKKKEEKLFIRTRKEGIEYLFAETKKTVFYTFQYFHFNSDRKLIYFHLTNAKCIICIKNWRENHCLAK